MRSSDVSFGVDLSLIGWVDYTMQRSRLPSEFAKLRRNK